MQRRRAVKVTAASRLSPSVRSLVLEVSGEPPFTYLAGQAVDLFVPTPSGMAMKRPYSIASAPGRAGPRHIEIAVTRVEGGPASTALHDMPVGTEMALDGPRGNFTRRGAPPDAPALFVGAGTGLAPLRAMLQEELAKPAGPPMTLLFGCRTEADVLWGDELRAWPHDPRFSLELTLSRPDETWHGRRGYVQRHVSELAERIGEPEVYVCGLSAMVEDVLAVLSRAGVARTRVHAEEYD